jgi:ribonucleoside-diphosphate reductase alpha chain
MGAMKGRPNGLGMMGWQDLLFKLRIPFDSDEATNLLDRITEVISYSAYEASVELAIEKGPAPIFKGSLPSQGIMPLDSMKMLGEDRGLDINVNLGYNLDWSVLKANIKKHGLRNLWVMAPAPTATISTVVGSYPTIEAQYSNLYVKENMSGTFVVLNKYLVNDLEKLGLWNEEMKNKIKDNQGKLLGIEGIPDDIVELYKDAFEIDQEKYIEQGAVMSKWIDQSHSRNIFVDVASGKVLNNIYMSAWESGLKSTYYLRSKGASNNNS